MVSEAVSCGFSSPLRECHGARPWRRQPTWLRWPARPLKPIDPPGRRKENVAVWDKNVGKHMEKPCFFLGTWQFVWWETCGSKPLFAGFDVRSSGWNLLETARLSGKFPRFIQQGTQLSLLDRRKIETFGRSNWHGSCSTCSTNFNSDVHYP